MTPRLAGSGARLLAPPVLRRPLVVSVEHAARDLPPWLPAERRDLPWLETHWGWDIGAADVAAALVAEIGVLALLSRWSRLACDTNRSPDAADLYRPSVEGVPLAFNRDQSPAERARRLARLHAPYHEDLGCLLRHHRRRAGHVVLLSLHSFTPVWAGSPRPMEVGVLFDHCEEEAEDLALRFEALGLRVARNAPYSGRDGMIFSASHHGRSLRIPFVELEIRQDLLQPVARAHDFGRRIAGPIAAWFDARWGPGRR